MKYISERKEIKFAGEIERSVGTNKRGDRGAGYTEILLGLLGEQVALKISVCDAGLLFDVAGKKLEIEFHNDVMQENYNRL